MPSYHELKTEYETKKTYLAKPDGINQFYQAEFVELDIQGSRVHYIFLLMDYYSRYLLTLKVYPAMTSDALIVGLENALEEAIKLTSIDIHRIITLVTDNSPAMIEKKTARYIEMSPFFHIRGKSAQMQGMMARLIRTIKEEEIYGNNYRDIIDAGKKLEKFRQEYNNVRPHGALGYKTPYVIYTGNNSAHVHSKNDS